MRFKEILLDFTSLLDVIMIILFWFILNYHQQTKEVRQQAEDARAAASEAQSIAAQQAAEAEERKAEAEQELSILYDVNERYGQTADALIDFQSGRSLRLDIQITDEERGYWELDMYQGEDFLTRMEGDRDSTRLGLYINDELKHAGFSDDATIICAVTYDSSRGYSKDAREAVEEQLRNIQKGNPHFYYTVIDTYVTAGGE